ncbi:NAD(P)-dependent oxidoreductase [Legionella shakespearei]|uniref:3-hydroxyisobutyrate dehydrogenase n=1 Tax=Legionella shakespearei DSM 23087 TaxID=1122169 RepID=A0A0W0Z7H0_9GAMM|nr:NAD(P)-dependent oxidoreductase [Legionella shakespearei]KTD65068.1 3-hydroxyisobutyrate dehydrogenase [Legionella shakespearei DSM 23087]
MNVTFIGLGKMGSAMVERLLQSGYDVTVYNRTASKALPLVKLGAKYADSVGLAVKEADVVMSCLLNDQAVLEMVNEAVKHMKSKALHVCLSTILPDTSVILEQLHESNNTQFVSAVVLGIPKVVQKGAATAFCAGSEQNVETVLPLLKTFSTDVIPLGDNIKAANIMKICLNYSLATALELISELYTFAEKSGLDSEVIKMGLHQIYGHPAFKLYIDKIHERNFDDVNFDMKGGNKDITIFQEAFARVGVVPELGNIVKSRFISALSHGMENKDWSAIYEIVRAQSGLKE